MKIEFKQNFDVLAKAIKELPEGLQNSILKSFNRDLAKKHIIEELKSQLPYSQRHKKDYILTSVSGDKTGIKAGVGRDSWPLQFPEGGTRNRYAKKFRGRTMKTKAFRGRVIGRHRVEDIIDKKIPDIVDDYEERVGEKMVSDLKKRIVRQQKKLNPGK